MAKTPRTAKPKAAKPAAPQPAATVESSLADAIAAMPRVDWQPAHKAALVDGKLYTGFARGRQIDVLHRGGEFFTDAGGSWSLRLDGVTHVRERLADPS